MEGGSTRKDEQIKESPCGVLQVKSVGRRRSRVPKA